MALRRYTGAPPSNVSKEAKYSVVSGTNADNIRLVYRVSDYERELLTTSSHPDLAAMVNAVKIELRGTPRGAFYINEYGDVLVPDGLGGAYWAGHYDKRLEFEYEGRTLSASAPSGLQPGDTWPGPHVGIRYVLAAGGGDVKYKTKSGTTETTVLLSRQVGAEPAGRLARRLAALMGGSGGRFYVNEAGEMFSPGRAPDGVGALYLGHIDDDQWFAPPDGFERP